MTKKFLTGAYHLENQQQTKQLYVDWADTYDQELAENGYASPKRIADALIASAADTNTPVLDIGCGSGLSGLCLKAAGFKHIVGSDFSPEMLAKAEEKAVYHELHLANFNAPFDFIDQPFMVITAVGVFSVGHAEPDVLKTIIDLMPEQGLFAYTLNDHALDNPGYMEQLQQSVLDKQVRIRWQEYGVHMPGTGLQSMNVVVQKLAGV